MSNIHPLAGKLARRDLLVSQNAMLTAYKGWRQIDKLDPVKNGTSGHRGSTGKGFSEIHVLSMTQALCDIRKEKGTFGPAIPPQMEAKLAGKPLGPIVIGKDVRYTSDFAHDDVVDVLIGNGMQVVTHKNGKATPTPVVSHEILRLNNIGANAEGIIITASHNPAEEAGMKSNGRDGGPNTQTKPIDEIANRYMKESSGIQDGFALERKGLLKEVDLITPYVLDLKNVVDLDVIKGSRLKFGVTPLGGAACGYYEAINEIYGTDIKVFLGEPDPAGSCRTYDWDGKLRGDPSSQYVMMAVKGIREKNGLAAILANDNDSDRFGIEDSKGILNPNHVLSVVADYLCSQRGLNPSKMIGRTIGSTHMLDLIADRHGRKVNEVNVGFKWYVEGLISGKYVIAGEESAGLSIPRFDGSVWVTEKDGIMANLLMMEIMARTGKDIGTLYGELEARYGKFNYERIDSPATDEIKAKLAALCADPGKVSDMLKERIIAGRRIERIKVGDGVKVVLEGGVWMLFRASGTENIIKVYREERGDTFDTARKATDELQEILGLG